MSAQIPEGATPADLQRFIEREARMLNTRSAKRDDGMTWEQVMEQLSALPEPTPEQRAEMEKRRIESDRVDRLSKFRRICPPEFMQRIDRSLLANPAAFDSVAKWDGHFPGPLASGATGSAKTRAVWSALGRLNVEEGRSFAWFPVKRLITEFVRYESKDAADEFWRFYRGFNVLFVDDLDKINWQFESEGAALFQFYDWAYRDNRPVITTTNKDRAWWANKQGDAFARRLFDEAHFHVKF